MPLGGASNAPCQGGGKLARRPARRAVHGVSSFARPPGVRKIATLPVRQLASGAPNKADI
eukprot:1235556-Alexandrium_andersonii.AAC.1